MEQTNQAWRKDYMLRQQLRLAYAMESLDGYLKHCTIDCAPKPEYYGNIREPWQETIDNAMVPAFEFVSGYRDEYKGPLGFFLVQPRGTDKTSRSGRIANFLCRFSKKRVKGVAAASTRDQANFLWESMKKEAALNRWYTHSKGKRLLEFTRHKVAGPGGELRITSAEASGSLGYLCDFFFCDELTVWEKEDLWSSIYSAWPKRPSVLVCTMNAGFKDTWQDWLIHGRPEMDGQPASRGVGQSPRWWVWNPVGADGQAGWIDPEFLQEQKENLPESVFNRLWLNEWSAERGDYLAWEDIIKCRDESLKYRREGDKNQRYLASIDYGEKRDRTVCVVMHMESGRAVIDRMDVWVPKPKIPVEVQVVEDWMKEVNRSFYYPLFVVDDHQLAGTIQRLTPECRIERWRASELQDPMSKQLRNAVLNRIVRWYPGCGDASDTDLERELSELVVKETRSGWRFDHTSTKHDDRAVALGMGLFTLLQMEPIGRPIDPETFDLTTERGKSIELRIQERMKRLEKMLEPSEN